jgi:hypothetical protein
MADGHVNRAGLYLMVFMAMTYSCQTRRNTERLEIELNAVKKQNELQVEYSKSLQSGINRLLTEPCRASEKIAPNLEYKTK